MLVGFLLFTDLGVGCGLAKAEALMYRTYFVDFDAALVSDYCT